MKTRSTKSLVSLALICASMAIAAALIFGFMGRLHPAFDSFSHFRVHLGVLLALVAILLFAFRFRWEGIAAFTFAIAALSTTAHFIAIPGLQVHAANPAETAQPAYKLLQLNLRFDNPDQGKVFSLIGRTKPDVITLNEVSSMWQDRLEILKASYPFGIVCPRPNKVFGVAILSRRPMVEGQEAACHDRGALAIAPVDFGGRPVTITALHLGWPWPFEQSRQIGLIEERLSTIEGDAILAGDFNAAPWSASVRRVAMATDMVITPSIGPTWLHHSLPTALRFMGLPIDQILHKGGITIRSAHTSDEAGSDHLPILVEFSLPAPPPPPSEEKTTVLADHVEAERLSLAN